MRRGVRVGLLAAVLSIGARGAASAAPIPIATFEIGPDINGLFDGVAAINNISDSRVGTIDVPPLSFIDVSLNFCDGSVRPVGDISMADQDALCDGSVLPVPVGTLDPAGSLKYDFWLADLFASPGQPWLFVTFAPSQASQFRLGAGRLLLDGVVSLDCSGDDCVRTVYFEPVPEPATLLLLGTGLGGLLARRRRVH